MKKLLLAICVLSVVACGDTQNKKNTSVDKVNETDSHLKTEKPRTSGEYASFGKRIAAEQAMASEEMYAKYQDLKIGDTLEVKFAAKVTDVCKKKGCWMKLSLPEGKETMVKFKDYAFFMPKDIEKKQAIVHGKAYVTIVPVDEQRHYAKDAGKSKEEIAAITKPKRTLSFLADGVLIGQ